MSMNIFHRVQMVILRCWTGLKLNWFKSYGTKVKKAKTAKTSINITKLKKREMEIFALCVITFEPIKIYTRSAPLKDCLNLSFVKYMHIVCKKWLETIWKRPFISRKFWLTVSSFTSKKKFLACRQCDYNTFRFLFVLWKH